MTLQETRAYDDIINLPHHQSRKHPHICLLYTSDAADEL